MPRGRVGGVTWVVCPCLWWWCVQGVFAVPCFCSWFFRRGIWVLLVFLCLVANNLLQLKLFLIPYSFSVFFDGGGICPDVSTAAKGPRFQPLSSQFVETAFKDFNGSHQFQEQKRKMGCSVCSCLNTGKSQIPLGTPTRDSVKGRRPQAPHFHWNGVPVGPVHIPN